ncbi:FAD-linked oxidase [Chlorella sorokiniana]|uniref:FAD-linked oxidase n=1 Tax=Chlorella sorokiniana TaxID=3076 RepID=A0A2P6TNU8_CHLSO|nr:FAD-linked oxidase [Chlorella sorokiniana]|eukprot:PRW51004.1 FAD-linked oxidase [Chlorella sorokiniana]
MAALFPLLLLLLAQCCSPSAALRLPRRHGSGLAAGRLLLAAPGNDAFAQLNATQADVKQLTNSLGGSAVLLGDPEYDKARNFTNLINLMHNDQAPALVVYAASEDDVASAVRFAAQRRLPLCVRSGGHDSTGASICDKGVVVDISQMNQIKVDAKNEQAVLGAGVRFREFIEALAAEGYAALTGDCPTVGISGFSLGGGWGKLTKSKGLGIDNVLEYRVVLPDGRTVVANETGEYSDLFWALRGGGHQNFGVVTGLKYRIFPQDQLLIYNATWDAAADPQRAAEVLHKWQESYLNKEPLELSFYPHFYAERESGKQEVVLYGMYTDMSGGTKAAEKRLRALLEPLEALQPEQSSITAISPTEMPGVTDGLESTIVAAMPPPGQQPELWELKLGQYTNRSLSLAEYRSLIDGWSTWPQYPAGYDGPAFTYAYFESVEGAAAARPPNATAYVHRTVGFDVVTDAFFMAVPGAEQATQAWLDDLYGKRWAPLLSGRAYQNYPSDAYLDAQQPYKAQEMYFGDNLCRLVAVKNKYDPTGVFRPAQGVPLSYPDCPK